MKSSATILRNASALFAGDASYGQRVRRRSDSARSSKERREDPVVMSIDAIEGHDRIALAATRDAQERTAGIGGGVFTAGRRFAGFSVEYFAHLRDQSSEILKLRLHGRRRSSGINRQGLNQLGKFLRSRAD